MIGTNELHLNIATMMQAIQEWLNTKIPHEAPIVTNVRKSEREENIFIITVSDKLKEP